MTLIMFYQFFITLVDVYIAGKIGKEVQAAYGFVVQIYFILVVIGIMLSVGTVTIVARLYTAKNERELTKTVYSISVFSIITGIGCALIGFFFAPIIAAFLNIPHPVHEYVIPLIKVYSLGLLFNNVLIAHNSILRACDMIRKSLKIMTFVCISNIVLNFYLVFNTSLGYKGIAVATAISLCLGSIFTVRYLLRLIVGPRQFSIQIIKDVLSIGWPIGVLHVSWQIGSAVIYIILGSLPIYPVEVLAALTNGLRIESAIFLPAFAFNMASAAIIGNYLGTENKKDAFKSGITTGLLGVTIITSLTVVVISNARAIASVLSNNTHVVDETVRYLRICMLGEPIMAWGIILSGGLKGAGDTRTILFRSGLSFWLLRIPLSYLFVTCYGFGPASVWWSMNISNLMYSFLITKRYLSKQWLA